jgi:chromosome segregation ATPase
MKRRRIRENSAEFLALRRTIEQFGYADLPLGLDSAPLVVELVADICRDTETIQHLHSEMEQYKGKIDIIEGQLEPLSSENIRLQRENIQLHQKILTTAEELVRTQNQSSMESFELQTENRRLKLLNKKSTDHVRQLQLQIDELKVRVSQLTSAPEAMKLQESMESDARRIRRGGTRTPSATSRATSIAGSDGAVGLPQSSFDVEIRVELENLCRERDAAQAALQTAAGRLTEVENLLQIRDTEIERLGAEVQRSTGRGGFHLTLQHKYEQQTQQIGKLEAQMRSLQARPAKRTFSLVHWDAPISIPPGCDKEDPPIKPLSTNEAGVLSEVSTIDSIVCEEEEEEEQAPKPRAPIKPEPIPGERQPRRVSFHTDNEKVRPHPKPPAPQPAERPPSPPVQPPDSRRIRFEIEVTELHNEVDSLSQQIREKEELIAKMAADFAFVNDKLSTILTEKDLIIAKLQEKVDQPPPVVDSEEVETLQLQIEEMKIRHEEVIQRRDDQVRQLHALVQSLSTNTSASECKECIRLRQKLEDATKAKASTDSTSQTEVTKLRTRLSQLEVLIQAMQTEQVTSSAMSAELQIMSQKIGEKDEQLEQMKLVVNAQKTEIRDYERKQEDFERKFRSVPDMEQRYKSVVDQVKTEHLMTVNELKQRGAQLKAVGEKLSEAQRAIRELESQLQKAEEEANAARKEAEFHRAKSEEVAKRVAEESDTTARDANATIQHLQLKLQEKVKECNLYQKLLSDTRRQLAPLIETAIPQYKSHIAKLTREKDELLRKVKRLAQLTACVEQGMGDTAQSRDVNAFCVALHQLQEELAA